ncbi:MAG: PQQ-like beta-propeller repeat protein [Actinomycetota bacterium]|nr:PQQ-like beta-propeller repeat protein [Actinomycetota bacterium]
MNRWLLAIAALVVTAGAVLVFVLTGDDEPAAAPPPTTTAKPEPTLRPLVFAPEPSWSIRRGSSLVDVREGLALAEDSEHLTLMDAATGATRWQLTAFEDMPAEGDIKWQHSRDTPSRLVPHDGGLAVLTQYFWTDCPTDLCTDDHGPSDESGLVLLSAADASVLWKTPVRPSVNRPETPLPPWYELSAVDDRTAVVTFYGGGTAAVSVETGEQLWRRPGLWGVAVAGDTVLAQAGGKPGIGPGKGVLMPGTVTALDLSTGAPRWDLADEYTVSEVVETGGDTVLVRVRSGEEPVGKLLALDDGHELAEAEADGFVAGCATDGALLACPTDDGVVIHDLETGAVTRTGVAAIAVDRIQDGRIFLIGSGNRAWTIDAVGNVIDAELPGRVVAMTTGHICFVALDPKSGEGACHTLG